MATSSSIGTETRSWWFASTLKQRRFLSKPQPILKGPFSTTDVSQNYDVSRDGTEFFAITRDPELAIGRSLQLIMNPFAKR